MTGYGQLTLPEVKKPALPGYVTQEDYDARGQELGKQLMTWRWMFVGAAITSATLFWIGMRD